MPWAKCLGPEPLCLESSCYRYALFVSAKARHPPPSRSEFCKKGIVGGGRGWGHEQNAQHPRTTHDAHEKNTLPANKAHDVHENATHEQHTLPTKNKRTMPTNKCTIPTNKRAMPTKNTQCPRNFAPMNNLAQCPRNKKHNAHKTKAQYPRKNLKNAHEQTNNTHEQC